MNLHTSAGFEGLDKSQCVLSNTPHSYLLHTMSRHLAISDLLNPILPSSSSSLSVESNNSEPIPEMVTLAPASVQYNVKLNCKMTLMKLYHYDLSSYVEYPKSSMQGPIGHLFHVNPMNWENPALNFAYSCRKPSGHTKEEEVVYCILLTDGNGEEVPCQECHTICM
jgi:hypothetical protein